MNLRAQRQQRDLTRPETVALLAYLLGRRSPIRVTLARADLALTTRQFSQALRALERHGLARRLRVLSAPGSQASLHQHLFIEATELAALNQATAGQTAL